MSKTRVLVVDDSVVFRRLLTHFISADPALEAVGFASSGRLALAKIPHLNPDVVTLDLEMPEMSGVETLIEIRKTWPRLPVLVMTAINLRDAASTLDALDKGANDYIAKPAGLDLEAALKQFQEELVGKILALKPATRAAPKQADTAPARLKASTRRAAGPPTGRASPPEVLAIGVSTGGPNALAELLSRFPADFPIPVLIVQHMPPLFTRLLAERLSAKGPLTVHEAMAGDVLRPAQAWLAPGDYHMIVERNGDGVRVGLHQGPPENACRPAVDVLFRSVAGVYRSRALAVVMTGMGYDGLRGAERIREAGGRLLAQDEATSVVWGMPGAVAGAGLAEAVVPLEHLADEIMRRVYAGRGPSTHGCR